jgi:hypothetical protein
MEEISIAGIDKAVLLAELYNNARPQGMGYLHFTPDVMTDDDARRILAEFPAGRPIRFDYLKGRVMKVDITGDVLKPWLYDRDNGEGAAANVVELLKQGVSR